ncbi:hypothetical protein CEXT_580491 [Caerostris extrusa]|uniref:Uncharacterized protein n=1 Tax=Caerostris extrusa TaxID=172846 RepID=A0AAV4U166_CAEEX|nr:hypothetical protein CEXT_580491 [Caerostris extrusa]
MADSRDSGSSDDWALKRSNQPRKELSSDIVFTLQPLNNLEIVVCKEGIGNCLSSTEYTTFYLGCCHGGFRGKKVASDVIPPRLIHRRRAPKITKRRLRKRDDPPPKDFKISLRGNEVKSPTPTPSTHAPCTLAEVPGWKKRAALHIHRPSGGTIRHGHDGPSFRICIMTPLPSRSLEGGSLILIYIFCLKKEEEGESSKGMGPLEQG